MESSGPILTCLKRCNLVVLVETMSTNYDNMMDDYDAATAGQNFADSREKGPEPNVSVPGLRGFIQNLKDRLKNFGKKAVAMIPTKSAEAKAYEKIAGSLGMLVMGAKPSGKQTFMLVLENLFGDSVVTDGFYSPMIHQAIIDGFKAIIDWAQNNDFDLVDYAGDILDITEWISDNPLHTSIALPLKRCWVSPWAQAAYDHRADISFPLNPLAHYMSRLDFICSVDYIPSLQDALRVPLAYNKEGVRDLDLNIDGIDFRVTALCRNDSSSINQIARQFEDPPIALSCLVYLCSLPYIDPKTAKDSPPLAETMKDALQHFAAYTGLACFQSKPVLVVFTKADEFFGLGREEDPHEIIKTLQEMFRKSWTGDSKLLRFRPTACYSERDVLETFLDAQELIADYLSSST